MFPETLSKTQRTNLKHDFVPEVSIRSPLCLARIIQSLNRLFISKHISQNTYSISIHGMYMDFVRWEVANLPGLRPIDLRLFWGDMPV